MEGEVRKQSAGVREMSETYKEHEAIYGDIKNKNNQEGEA